MTDENRRANVALELVESASCRDAAELNAASGHLKTAVNRLYYACFHAARAVLLTAGLEPKRHSGLRHMLSLHFVKTGLLPSSVSKTLAHLEDEREMADYIAASTLSADEYEAYRAEAEELLELVRRFLSTAGWTD